MTDRMHKRRRPIRYGIERLLDTLLLDGKVAAWSYRRGLQGRLRVSRHEHALASDKRLPRPLVIAFASDFHAGPTTHPGMFDALGEELEQARPDLVLLGGDYVSLGGAHVEKLQALLARAAAAPLGAFAVIGNHDIWHGRGPIEDALRQAGVQLLVNRNAALAPPFDMVSICGIDDPWTGLPSAPDTFAGAGPVRVYLMHSPDGLWHLRGEQFDLGLAGHTHAGQVARADGRPVIRPSGPVSADHCYGRYEFAHHGPLIVSSGVGCSALPLRINADPELVICTLS
jgi:uncharacterized protein